MLKKKIFFNLNLKNINEISMNKYIEDSFNILTSKIYKYEDNKNYSINNLNYIDIFNLFFYFDKLINKKPVLKLYTKEKFNFYIKDYKFDINNHNNIDFYKNNKNEFIDEFRHVVKICNINSFSNKFNINSKSNNNFDIYINNNIFNKCIDKIPILKSHLYCFIYVLSIFNVDRLVIKVVENFIKYILNNSNENFIIIHDIENANINKINDVEDFIIETYFKSIKFNETLLNNSYFLNNLKYNKLKYIKNYKLHCYLEKHKTSIGRFNYIGISKYIYEMNNEKKYNINLLFYKLDKTSFIFSDNQLSLLDVISQNINKI